MRSGVCSRCGNLVAWVSTVDGRRISIDILQNPAGSVYLDGQGQARPWNRGVRAGTPRYASHLVGCPGPEPKL